MHLQAPEYYTGQEERPLADARGYNSRRSAVQLGSVRGRHFWAFGATLSGRSGHAFRGGRGDHFGTFGGMLFRGVRGHAISVRLGDAFRGAMILGSTMRFVAPRVSEGTRPFAR